MLAIIGNQTFTVTVVFTMCAPPPPPPPPPLLSPPGGDSHFRRVGVLVIVGHYTGVIDILYVTDHP